MNPEETHIEFVECRSCKSGVLSVYKFCGACGEPTALLNLEREMLKSYCGRCGSTLRGLKKYCSQCGDASLLTREGQGQNRLLELLQNPRFQMGLAAILVAILALPLFSPVRYGLTSAAPFLHVYVENEEAERLALQVSRRSWSIRQLELDDVTIAEPSGIAVDGLGAFFVADAARHSIFRITPSGATELYAGRGEAGFDGDEGPAAEALFNKPGGLALDPAGHLYVADSGNDRIRMIDPDGRVFTVAGCGDCRQSSMSDSDAKNIRLLNPAAVAFSGESLLVAEAPGGAGATRPPTVWSLLPKR